MTRVALVPLDDRPVCTSLPAAIAAVAGATVVTPPAGALSSLRDAGDVDALGRWVGDVDADAFVVSLEGMGFGGLIPSRIGQESVADVLARWQVLATRHEPVHAAVVIPRTPDTLDASEEPDYWSAYGPDLHALSSALRDAHLQAGGDLDARRAAIPAEIRADWLGRRLRQHALVLAALELVSRDVVVSLQVGVDDAGPSSLSSAEQDDVVAWVERLELAGRVAVQPGADETGAVLTARALVGLSGGAAPRIRIECAVDDGLDRVATYETGPVGDTARRQISAAGATVVEDSPDAVLVVHPPDFAGDWTFEPPRPTDAAAAEATADLVAKHVADGAVVGVADVGQPNGADPELVRALSERVSLPGLGTFAAWNTAGNTLGTAAAHLVAGVVGRRQSTYDQTAHEALIARRLVEDWAWMTVVRRQLRERLGVDPRLHDRVDERHPALLAAEPDLGRLLASVPGFEAWHVVPGSVRFPWRRTFEIDLDVATSTTSGPGS